MRDSLKKGGWDFRDNFFFAYDPISLRQYKTTDTMRDPKDNIANAIAFIQKLKEEFPLAQFNLIGHSLGGVFALEAAREHKDAVNNLILISSPVRGLNDNFFDRNIKAPVIKEFASQNGIDLRSEQVSNYLFNIWNDDYHKALDKFVAEFTGSGKVITDFFSNDDLFVPVESVELIGAKKITVSVKGASNPLEAHGRLLTNLQVEAMIGEIIGPNLAR